jgi:hypothetical protein
MTCATFRRLIARTGRVYTRSYARTRSWAPNAQLIPRADGAITAHRAAAYSGSGRAQEDGHDSQNPSREWPSRSVGVTGKPCEHDDRHNDHHTRRNDRNIGIAAVRLLGHENRRRWTSWSPMVTPGRAKITATDSADGGSYPLASTMAIARRGPSPMKAVDESASARQEL